MKKFLIMLTVCLFLSGLSVTAFAHPGKTDSEGGHYDHSTGAYHYHHGYSPHSHYDRNGDGVADCPYDFDDQTGANNGTLSSGGAASKQSYEYKDTPEISTVYKDRIVTKEVNYIPSWIKWYMGISALWIICLKISSRWKQQKIAELESSIQVKQEEAKKQKEIYDAELLKKKEAYDSRVGELSSWFAEKLNAANIEKWQTVTELKSENECLKKELHSVITTIPVGEAYFPEPSNVELSLYRIEIPDDVYFIEGKIPVKGIVTRYSPFGDFTVFTLSHSDIYHSNKYCNGTFSMEPVHLFDVMNRKRPCLRCGKNYGTTPPEWYTELIALQKYSD